MPNKNWINQGDIIRVIKRSDGAASVPEIADAIGKSTTAVRANVSVMVQAGQLVELGVALTGARCYGLGPRGEAL